MTRCTRSLHSVTRSTLQCDLCTNLRGSRFSPPYLASITATPASTPTSAVQRGASAAQCTFSPRPRCVYEVLRSAPRFLDVAAGTGHIRSAAEQLPPYAKLAEFSAAAGESARAFVSPQSWSPASRCSPAPARREFVDAFRLFQVKLARAARRQLRGCGDTSFPRTAQHAGRARGAMWLCRRGKTAARSCHTPQAPEKRLLRRAKYAGCRTVCRTPQCSHVSVIRGRPRAGCHQTCRATTGALHVQPCRALPAVGCS